jgi:dihydropteroate synthase
MWRYLTGLNKTDLEQELGSINSKETTPFQFEDLQHLSFIKAVGISETQRNFIKTHLHNFVEIIIESREDEKQKRDLIFSISPVLIKKFRKKILTDNLDGLAQLKELLQNISINQWTYHSRNVELKIDRPLIMGILNVTPDSFSDGGKYFSEDQAYRHGIEMIEAGADIIDIGGESTRPGSIPVSIDQEWQRICGVIGKLLRNNECIISVDTYKSEIARRALEIGIHIINDISGLTFDPAIAAVVSKFKVPIILMHIKGTPRDMQKDPSYNNLMDEVYQFLFNQCQLARDNGINQIIIDPGIGFGKRPQDNFELIRRLGEFKALRYPILLGTSQKSFIAHGLQDSQIDRKIGSITSIVSGILNGANIVRVHDIEETRQALQIIDTIANSKAIS